MKLEAFINEWGEWVEVEGWTPSSIKIKPSSNQEWDMNGSLKTCRRIFRDKKDYKLRLTYEDTGKLG